MQHIPDEVWNRNVISRPTPALAGQPVRTFGEEVGQKPKLLIFLRHLG
jgi:hypothetical protein